jgi:hypothetical protein
MTWLGSPEVTAGSDLVTMACCAGHENGPLVVEEYHLIDLPRSPWMSVCLVKAKKASCRVPGCECHDRVPRHNIARM